MAAPATSGLVPGTFRAPVVETLSKQWGLAELGVAVRAPWLGA